MVSFGHLIAVLAVAVSAASIAIAVYQYRRTVHRDIFRVYADKYRRTVHRDIFRVYADKYDAILQPEIYPQWQKALAGDNTHWERLTPVMIAYLNLIWEECYLAGDRVIPKQLWELWRPEIQRVLRSDFAKQIMNTCDFHFPEELTCGSARRARELRGSQM